MNRAFTIPGFSPPDPVPPAQARVNRLWVQPIDHCAKPPSLVAQIFSRTGAALLRDGLEHTCMFVTPGDGGYDVEFRWQADLPANDYLLRYSLDGVVRELPFTVLGPQAVRFETSSPDTGEALSPPL